MHVPALKGSLDCMYINFFWTSFFLLFRPGVFSLALGYGACRIPCEHWVQVWALAKVSGTFSGGSKSRKLVDNHGITFRPARANQAHANPKNEVFGEEERESSLNPPEGAVGLTLIPLNKRCDSSVDLREWRPAYPAGGRGVTTGPSRRVGSSTCSTGSDAG